MITLIWDPRTARVLTTTLVFACALYLLHQSRATLTLFLFAILFSYFLDPLVNRLELRFRNRLSAIATVYAALVAALLLFAWLLGPHIASEGRSLATTLPNLLDQMASGEFIQHLGKLDGLSASRQSQVQQFFMEHKGKILDYGEATLCRLDTPASHIWWLILIPILGLFFLKDAPAIATGIVNLGRTTSERTLLAAIVEDINTMLSNYIRAQIILAGLTIAFLTLVLSLMRVPYAFVLGPLAGLCEFVPVVGPAVASAIIFGLGILAGYPHLAWLFFMLGLWRVIQDYINAPRIFGKSLEISPLAEIFVVLAGGEIGGVIGALVAVPLLAILRILWCRLVVVTPPTLATT